MCPFYTMDPMEEDIDWKQEVEMHFDGPTAEKIKSSKSLLECIASLTNVSEGWQRYGKFSDMYSPSSHRQSVGPESLNYNDSMEIYSLASDFHPASARHIASYNHFMFRDLPHMIENETIKVISRQRGKIHEFKFSNLFYSKPKMNEKTIDFSDVSNTDNSDTNTLLDHVQCELRKASYLASMFVSKARHTVYDFFTRKIVETNEIENLFLGEVPVMVHSALDVLSTGHRPPASIGADWNDFGGHFIIHGTPRVVVGGFVMKFNHIFIHHNPNHPRRKYAAEIRCRNWNLNKSSTKLVINYTPSMKNSIHELNAEMTFLNAEIPLSILFFALGATCPEDVFEIVVGTRNLRDPSVNRKMAVILNDLFLHEEVKNMLSICRNNPQNLQNEAKIYIGCRSMSSYDLLDKKTVEEKETVVKQRIKYAEDFLANSFLCHIGTVFQEKYAFLGMMTRRLLNVACQVIDPVTKMPCEPDDREKIINKRIEIDAAYFRVLASLFLKKMVKEAVHKLKAFVDTDRPNPGLLHVLPFKWSKMFFTHFLSNGTIPNMSSGKPGKTGLTNPLFMNLNCQASSYVKNDNPALRDSPLISPREVDLGGVRDLCSSETPEGHTVGFVNYSTVLSIVTTGDNPFDLFDIMDENGIPIVKCTPQQIFEWTKVFIDGMWKWMCSDPVQLEQKLRQMKRLGEISWQTSIYYKRSQQSLFIECSEGRMMTPALVIETDPITGRQYLAVNKVVKNMATKEHAFHPFNSGWEGMLMYKGYIEYLGSEELQSSNNLICVYPSDLNKPDKITGQITKYQWCEIHPSIVFSFSGAILPFVGTGPTTRTSFAESMGKQATSLPFMKPYHQYTTGGLVTWYPQRPLCMTKNRRAIDRFEEDGTVQNFFMAIKTSNSNIDDAIIVSDAPVQRGMGRTTIYRKEEDKVKVTLEGKQDKHTIVFAKPANASENTSKNFSAIDNDGLPIVGACINAQERVKPKSKTITLNGVILEAETGRVLNFNNTLVPELANKHIKANVLFGKEKQGEIPKDISKTYNRGEAIVQRVIMSETNGDFNISVLLRSNTQLSEGDKMCLPPWTLIFTLEKGWIRIDKAVDLLHVHILCLDDHGRAYFRKPKNWHIYGVGEHNTLSRINTKTYPLVCTNEHKLCVSRQDDFSDHFLTPIREVKETLHLSCYIKSYMRMGEIEEQADKNWKHIVDKMHRNATFAIVLLLAAALHQDENDNYFPWESDTEWLLPKDLLDLPSLRAEWKTMILKDLDLRSSTETSYLASKGSNETFDKIMNWVKRMFRNEGNWADVAYYFWATSGKEHENLTMFFFHLKKHGRGSKIFFSSAKKVDLLTNVFVFLQHQFHVVADQYSESTFVVSIKKWNTVTKRFSEKIDSQQISVITRSELEEEENQLCEFVYCPDLEDTPFLISYHGHQQWTGNSSNHAQKAVISRVEKHQNMMFIPELGGIRPDLEFNPHGFPSRMTEGQKLELALGMLCVKKGLLGDATSFELFSHHDLYDDLIKAEMNQFSEYWAYDGITGERYPEKIFCGFISYKVLKHMAKLKNHARATGPVNFITHQATCGKRNDGGGRFGEMEVKCLGAWSTSHIQQQVNELSDQSSFWVCDQCAYLACQDDRTGKVFCLNCESTTFHRTRFPWAAKTLFDELRGMGIATYLYVTDEQIQREKERKKKLYEQCVAESQ